MVARGAHTVRGGRHRQTAPDAPPPRPADGTLPPCPRVAQAELKRILSFTLVSHVGYMIFGIAIATPAAIGATIYYMVHHIVVQTTLFLAVGLVERRAGSTSILKVKGLMRAAPVIALLYFIPAVNLGGLPPFSGFIGKYALFAGRASRPRPTGRRPSPRSG